jgi:hypothetical protein
MWRKPVGLGAKRVRTTDLLLVVHTRRDREVGLLGADDVAGGDGYAQLVQTNTEGGRRRDSRSRSMVAGTKGIEHDHQVLQHVEGRVEAVAAPLLGVAVVVGLESG